MIYKKISYGDWTNWKFKLQKAEGAFLWINDGEKVLDFTSGWNVSNLGWNNPEVRESILRQLSVGTFNPIWTSSQIQEDYAEELTKYLPSSLNTIIKTTGGTEANEVAIKLARSYSNRKKILGFSYSYHGQLFASLSLGFPSTLTEQIGPMVPDIFQIPYPSSDGNAIEDIKRLSEFSALLETYLENMDIAAIVVEPEMVTGWGTCRVACEGFMRCVRDLTTKYSTLMIVDEIGTGFSRLGTLFGIEISGIVPDIITFAKASTNGSVGIGTVVSSEHIINPTTEYANYISTFGWQPLACAAGLTTLRIHNRDRIWQSSQKYGDLMKQTLESFFKKNNLDVLVRGKGLEIGLDFNNITNNPAVLVKNIEENCLKNGLHIIDGGEGCIPLMPPCTIKETEILSGINILVDVTMTSIENYSQD